MQRPSVRNSINYSNKRLAYSRQWGNRKVDIEYNGKKRVSGKMNKPFRHHILQGGQNHPICNVKRFNSCIYLNSWNSFFCHFSKRNAIIRIRRLHDKMDAKITQLLNLNNQEMFLLVGTLYAFCTALMEYTLNKN